jgi:hypothetical protein
MTPELAQSINSIRDAHKLLQGMDVKIIELTEEIKRLEAQRNLLRHEADFEQSRLDQIKQKARKLFEDM